MITKAHEYGKFPGIYVILLIYYNGRYITYCSKRNKPLSIKEIISKILSKIERIKANHAIAIDIFTPNQSAFI
jgi:hypothetical protein